jgi:membrane-associated protease RseP (regulator of RpoE activity)
MGYTRLGFPKNDNEPQLSPEQTEVRRKTAWILPLGLFLLSIVSTSIAGAAWAGKNPLEVTNWFYGIQYSLLILTFLASHEFGHYFAAKYHGVNATLPYVIPMPPPMLFGTAGAVMRTRSAIMTRKALFDIGVAGPLAGFVVCVAFLIIGFANLPSMEYLYKIHPEYRIFGGAIPEYGLRFGDTILYSIIGKYFASPDGFIPPMNEMYHYPFLCVGWFGLFVTSLNLLPIGQLDGGHIAHAMFGEKQAIMGRTAWVGIVILALGSVMSIIHTKILYDSPDSLYMFFQSLLLPSLNALHNTLPGYYQAWFGWVFWAIILRLFIGIEHPPIDDPEPLGMRRMIVGWLAVAILVVSFSYNGIYDIEPTEENAIPKSVPSRGDMSLLHPTAYLQSSELSQHTYYTTYYALRGR